MSTEATDVISAQIARTSHITEVLKYVLGCVVCVTQDQLNTFFLYEQVVKAVLNPYFSCSIMSRPCPKQLTRFLHNVTHKCNVFSANNYSEKDCFELLTCFNDFVALFIPSSLHMLAADSVLLRSVVAELKGVTKFVPFHTKSHFNLYSEDTNSEGCRQLATVAHVVLPNVPCVTEVVIGHPYSLALCHARYLSRTVNKRTGRCYLSFQRFLNSTVHSRFMDAINNTCCPLPSSYKHANNRDFRRFPPTLRYFLAQAAISHMSSVREQISSRTQTENVVSEYST